jgi:transcriptional regulator with XRE-family HTH domain
VTGWYVSEILPQLLADRGWTQEQLGDATGIARTDINLLCNGKKRLGLARARRIAAALDVTLLELGVPTASDPESNHLRARLATLEARAEELNAENERLDQLVVELSVRVEALEGGAASQGTKEP